jgi:hypothetical protein
MSGSDPVNPPAAQVQSAGGTSDTSPGPVPAQGAAASASIAGALRAGQRLLATVGAWAARPQPGSALRTIPTRQHGTLDYVLGVILVALPYLGGFANRRGAEWIPVLVGLALISYSLFTNYERGMMRVIPLGVHLRLDLGAGLILVAAGIIVSPGIGSALAMIVLGALLAALSQVTAAGADDAAGLPVPPVMTRTERSVRAMPPATGPSDAAGRPAYPVPPGDAERTEQVRGAIDSGATGDKVAMTDPAAAPLGSDQEAGQPHDEDGLRTAREAAAKPPA